MDARQGHPQLGFFFFFEAVLPKTSELFFIRTSLPNTIKDNTIAIYSLSTSSCPHAEYSSQNCTKALGWGTLV